MRLDECFLASSAVLFIIIGNGRDLAQSVDGDNCHSASRDSGARIEARVSCGKLVCFGFPINSYQLLVIRGSLVSILADGHIGYRLSDFGYTDFGCICDLAIEERISSITFLECVVLRSSVVLWSCWFGILLQVTVLRLIVTPARENAISFGFPDVHLRLSPVLTLNMPYDRGRIRVCRQVQLLNA